MSDPEVIGVFMHPAEMDLIKRLSTEVAQKFSPCNIVHIGVEWGGSLYCSRVGAPKATIYGVDIRGNRGLRGTDEQKKVLNHQLLEGDSQEIWKEFNEPIHFLYVDGDHHYEVLSADIKNWASKVVVGGYAAFHDCKQCHWALDVNRAIDEGLSAKDWEDLGIASWSRYFRRR